MTERRIDPDFVEPPLTRADIEALIRAVRPRASIKDGAGSSIALIWASVAATAAMAIAGWTLLAVVDLKTHIAVLECQLSPGCPKATLK